ncbi:restriction endonuclease [Chitinophaga polysaccharea]|uniref:restriction endonuclease n=1 Tax=Chitinophaga polysaccharea TaxID=1293035 RepID=UPI0014550AD4|nr:restriction endonuclease [Chitinophaga polysaccharea]NLR58887.1 restriction endonuclease [Chitinophaga polysaccharea]
MSQTDIFHYPPELFDLLVNTLPLLSRGKQSLILFFRGAGVPENLCSDLNERLSYNRDDISKYEIARTILTRINEKNEKYIRERRELLKRVIEFESFTNCWPEDQYKAQGLVAEIRKVVNVKDSFTRMKNEAEKEREKNREEYRKKVEEVKRHKEELENVKRKFYSLFAENNPQRRGKMLEEALNSLFQAFNILVREAFTRVGDNNEGIVEQIDGVVEISGVLYIVEMKWKKDPIGQEDIFQHLGRMYHRANTNGIYISASGYANSSILAAKEALQKDAILLLTDLKEFVDILENEKNLADHFISKNHRARLDKAPYTK